MFSRSENEVRVFGERTTGAFCTSHQPQGT
jgi:hypothetical protein